METGLLHVALIALVNALVVGPLVWRLWREPKND